MKPIIFAENPGSYNQPVDFSKFNHSQAVSMVFPGTGNKSFARVNDILFIFNLPVIATFFYITDLDTAVEVKIKRGGFDVWIPFVPEFPYAWKIFNDRNIY